MADRSTNHVHGIQVHDSPVDSHLVAMGDSIFTLGIQ